MTKYKTSIILVDEFTFNNNGSCSIHLVGFIKKRIRGGGWCKDGRIEVKREKKTHRYRQQCGGGVEGDKRGDKW